MGQLPHPLVKKIDRRGWKSGRSIFFVVLMFEIDTPRDIEYRTHGIDEQRRSSDIDSDQRKIHDTSPLAYRRREVSLQKSSIPVHLFHSSGIIHVNGQGSMTTCIAGSTLPPFIRAVFLL